MGELLKVENLGVAYGDLQVLHDIHIRVDTGEIVAVLGSNGAGKTTLLQAISGLLPIRQGRILLENRELAEVPAHELPSLGMAHVPQGRGIFTTLSVMENLTIGAWNPRGKKDRYTNYDRNNRNIALINHAYCADNPRKHLGYGADCWGLSAGINSGGGRPLPRDDR